MTRPREGFRKLEKEILGEKAAALGRAGERLELALRRTTSLARALEAAGNGRAREQLGCEYDAARREAQHARLALLIQREALGLRQHRMVDQLFPEPPHRP